MGKARWTTREDETRWKLWCRGHVGDVELRHVPWLDETRCIWWGKIGVQSAGGCSQTLDEAVADLRCWLSRRGVHEVPDIRLHEEEGS